MDFDFQLRVDDKVIEDKIKQALLTEINQATKACVSRQFVKFEGSIQAAVDIFLSKRLTDEYIKAEIDKAAKYLIEERLRND